MKFPIVLKDAPHLEPPGRLYYEIASNGVFQVKDTPIYHAVTRATRDVPGLYPSQERLLMKFPRLPAALVEDAVSFFDAVFEQFDGEAIVLLFYRAETREYRAEAPPQRIPGYRDAAGRLRAYLRLDYGSVPRPEGFVPFGTIHSHAELSAYASGVDCDDERFRGDGLHVVYGHFGRPPLSRSAAFVANGRRFQVEPEQVLPDCDAPAGPARSDWMARVQFEETTWGYASHAWNDSHPSAPSVPLLGVDGGGDATA